jgi:hypothetical protein
MKLNHGDNIAGKRLIVLDDSSCEAPPAGW